MPDQIISDAAKRAAEDVGSALLGDLPRAMRIGVERRIQAACDTYAREKTKELEAELRAVRDNWNAERNKDHFQIGDLKNRIRLLEAEGIA